MKTLIKRELALRLAATLSAILVSACGGPMDHNLVPLPGKEDQAPELTTKTTIVFDTTAGEVTIDVYPEAAPNAARRFIELVESGFYDDTPVSRIVPGFVAQFGVNWREPHNAWRMRTFDDDPSLFALERCTLAFAKAGANTNSTQVFINYAENNRLADPQYNFSVFGAVTSGMDIVDSFVQVGDPSGGLNQESLWNDGERYLASLQTQPTMIQSARLKGPGLLDMLGSGPEPCEEPAVEGTPATD